MAARRKPATAQPRREPPVRPADDRYLDDAALDERDALVLEKTGPDAQQLVAKREALRVRLDQLDDGQLAGITPDELRGFERREVIARATDAATTMPNAQYRELLEQLDQVLAGDDDTLEED